MSIEILSTKDIENVVDTNIALYSLISEGLNFRNCYICTQNELNNTCSSVDVSSHTYKIQACGDCMVSTELKQNEE